MSDYIESGITIHDLFTAGEVEVKTQHGLFEAIKIDFGSNVFRINEDVINVNEGIEAGFFRLKWLDEIDIAYLNFSRMKVRDDGLIVMVHNDDKSLQIGFDSKTGAVGVKTVVAGKKPKVVVHYRGIPKTKGHLLLILESLSPCRNLSLTL